MFSKRLTLLFLAVAINSARAEIDFTPVVKEYTAEGFTYRQLLFKNDKGNVSFTPPQNWSVRGDKGGLQLSPPDKHLVEATIQARPLVAPQPFDAAAMEAFEQQIIRAAPPGSQSIQVVKREENPVAMGQNLSLGVVISYQILGQTFQRSVVFVNCPDTQLILRFTAPKADFEVCNSDFRRSINSWQWIEPSPKVAKVEPTTAAAPAFPPPSSAN